ncbi:universal stress protein [Halocola ammonii]
MSKRKILVPTDFSKIGNTAIDHALVTAKSLDADIYILHIVGNKKDLPEAQNILSELAKQVKENHGVEVNTIPRIGSIYEDIDNVGVEIGADLVIMGTHGLRGMQFITGGRAIRIVTSSSIPFIVVQEKGIGPEGYDDIVVPLDLSKETKQKLKIVSDMAKYFKSRIHLISPDEKDEFLKKQLERNINFAREFFNEKGIKYTVKIKGKSESGFSKAVIAHAKESNADLICIMNLYEKSLMGMIGGKYEQRIITNEHQIPVMCVNPVETYVMNRSVFAS